MSKEEKRMKTANMRSLFVAQKSALGLPPAVKYEDLPALWSEWTIGQNLPRDGEWLSQMIAEQQLPQATYSWLAENEAIEREIEGKSIIVWWLDPQKKMRHPIALKRPPQTDLILTVLLQDWMREINTLGASTS